MSGPSEVAQLDVQSLEVCHQNILWLDVSVNHIAVLQVEKRLDYLSDYVTGTVLTETLLSPQFLV